MRYLIIIYVLFLMVLPADAKDSERANELFVAAIKNYHSSKAIKLSEDQLSLLIKALGNLGKIIERYPSTPLALRLISGQDIGNISLAAIREAAQVSLEKVKSEQERCWQSPSFNCVAAQALSAIKKVENAGDRVELHARIAGYKADAGDTAGAWYHIAEAKKALREMDVRINSIDWTQTWISIALLKVGDLEMARKTNNAISNIWQRQFFYWEIAVSKIKDKKYQEAILFAETEPNLYKSRRVGMLIEVAAAIEKDGNTERAKAILSKALRLASNPPKFDPLYSIAKIRAEMGDVEGARQVIPMLFLTAGSDSPEPALDRISFTLNLTKIAEVQITIENKIGAEPTLTKAINSLASLTNHSKYLMLESIARLQFRMGTMKTAIATVKSISIRSMRKNALVEVAKAAAQIKSSDERKTAYSFIKSSGLRLLALSERIDFLGELAAVQYDSGDQADAKKTISSAILELGRSGNQFGLISVIHAKRIVGDIKGSLALVGKLRTKWLRANHTILALKYLLPIN